ncbi:hypothetical protein Tco_1011471 [Tanacetum coccineum]
MSQQRKTMCTYMKNMARYKMEHFKEKIFYEVKEMFDKTYKQVTSFVPMDSVMEKERTKRADSRKYWKIIKVRNHTEVYEFFDDMLKAFDRDDLVKLWSLVKERFSSTDPTDDKERTLWVDLKRLFKLDANDKLWKLQRYIHDPLKWRLYDTRGVHHVSIERGMDIFMLVEKDYPLSKGVMMLMLVNKLLVEQSSEMANKLQLRVLLQFLYRCIH